MPISNEDLDLQNLMNRIVFVALEDGVITKDELAILKQLKFDINTLRKTIHEAGEKASITSDDANRLDKFGKNLIQNVYDISKNDHIITDDERKLINTLIKSILN